MNSPVRSIMHASLPVIRNMGLSEYLATWRAMQTFTAERDAATERYER